MPVLGNIDLSVSGRVSTRPGTTGVKRQSLRRASRLAVLGFTSSMFFFVALGCDEPEKAALEGRVPEPARQSHQRAAYAGVDWITENASKMPEGWAYATLSRLHRVVRNVPRVQEIEAALAEDASSENHRRVPTDFDDASLLKSNRLTFVLFELLRRKETGLPFQETAVLIEEQILTDESGFWAGIPMRHQPTLVYLFDELDISSSRKFEDVIDALRRATAGKDPESVAANPGAIYGLTHVVFARSRYFQNEVDPAGLEFAIPILQLGLAQRIEPPADVFSLDLIAEILISLKLMGQAQDDLTRAAEDRLLALQDADGSWGMGEGVTPRRIHPTFNAIVALLAVSEDSPQRESP